MFTQLCGHLPLTDKKFNDMSLIFLPPATEVYGKVMFSVCQFHRGRRVTLVSGLRSFVGGGGRVTPVYGPKPFVGGGGKVTPVSGPRSWVFQSGPRSFLVLFKEVQTVGASACYSACGKPLRLHRRTFLFAIPLNNAFRFMVTSCVPLDM